MQLTSKKKQNEKTHLHWHLLIFLHSVWKRKWGSGFLILQLDLYTPFNRRRNTTLPRSTVCPFYLNEDCTVHSYSFSSMRGGLKLSMAPVLGTLHSCTVTSAAVFTLSPWQGWLANKCYLSCKHVHCCSNYAHSPTHAVMQTEKDKGMFAVMAVMQPKLKMKQGRDKTEA